MDIKIRTGSGERASVRVHCHPDDASLLVVLYCDTLHATFAASDLHHWLYHRGQLFARDDVEIRRDGDRIFLSVLPEIRGHRVSLRDHLKLANLARESTSIGLARPS